MKRINNVNVSNRCWADAQGAIEQGQFVFLALPDAATANGACDNCKGCGHIILQFLGQQGEGNRSQTWHEGGWQPVKSRLYPCPMCSADLEKNQMVALMNESGLLPAEMGWRLDFLAGRRGKEEALAAARALLAQTPHPAGWLIFYGDYGVGKSGLLKVMTGSFIRAGVSACYRRAEDILREARASFNEGSDASQSEAAVRQAYGGYQFLAVDEVDRVSATPWARAFLFSLLDERYNRRFQVATALATNTQPGAFGEAWGYLESRMTDGQRVIVLGESLRGKG